MLLTVDLVHLKYCSDATTQLQQLDLAFPGGYGTRVRTYSMSRDKIVSTSYPDSVAVPEYEYPTDALVTCCL